MPRWQLGNRPGAAVRTPRQEPSVPHEIDYGKFLACCGGFSRGDQRLATRVALDLADIERHRRRSPLLAIEQEGAFAGEQHDEEALVAHVVLRADVPDLDRADRG